MPKVSSATKRSSRNCSVTPAHAAGQAKPPRKRDPTHSEPNVSGGVNEKVPQPTTSSAPTHVFTTAAPFQPIAPVEHESAATSTAIPPWSTSDDKTLIEARARGLNWNQISMELFPSKSPNACRKRHECLMERQTDEQWDGVQLGVLAQAYMEARREMWTVLAARVGEKWTIVEQKVCQCV